MEKEIVTMLDYIDIIDCVEYLEKLHDKIYHHLDLKRRERGVYLHYPIPVSYHAELVKKRILELTPKWYLEEVKTTSDEIVNGYALTDWFHFSEVGYRTYQHLCELWDDPDDLSYEEFVEKFNKDTCTDWNKMDEYGDPYGGFYRSEDPKIKENAYHLSGAHNRKMLWKLPFPKRFLLETVEIGCGRRHESVKDSNHMAVWFQRKRACDPTSKA